MKSTDVFIFAISLIILGLIVYYAVKIVLDKKRDKAVKDYFKTLLPEVELKNSTKKFYHYYFEDHDNVYLIKVLPFDLHRELIITNKYYWCINADLKGWKRSTIPDLFPGVKEYVDLIINTDKKVIKMALILPDCHNIIRYLNESDVAKVSPNDLVYGVYFVKAVDLHLFFTKTK